MYFYHGYALGVASTIPRWKFTQAVCALSVRGGVASARVDNFNSNGISFQSATSDIQGDEDNINGLDVYTTKASVVIQKLNLLGVVTADNIESHLISTHRVGDYELSTVITGSKFDNLQINGQAVNPQLSDDLSARYPTYDSMQVAFQNDFTRDNVLRCLVGYGLVIGAGAPDLRDAYDFFQQQKALRKLKATVLCSFVTKVNATGGSTAWGPIISVPNFGTIYLGEMMVWPWMRCLNMFRIELTPSKDYPSGGTISGGSAGGNGTTSPPGLGG
jgi:hypothetical protein